MRKYCFRDVQSRNTIPNSSCPATKHPHGPIAACSILICNRASSCATRNRSPSRSSTTNSAASSSRPVGPPEAASGCPASPGFAGWPGRHRYLDWCHRLRPPRREGPARAQGHPHNRRQRATDHPKRRTLPGKPRHRRPAATRTPAGTAYACPARRVHGTAGQAGAREQRAKPRSLALPRR